MTQFSDLKFKPSKQTGMGTQAIVEFNNGYSASVVCGRHTYGGSEGLYELAVLHDGCIDYSTSITSDVEGHLEEDAVTSLLQQIEALPKAEKDDAE